MSYAANNKSFSSIDRIRSACVSRFLIRKCSSAGTGDILSGVIVGLMAQGLRPFDTATSGVYLHAMAGELVRADVGEAGMVAGDLLPRLPLVIKRLNSSC
ncbi:TPA: hypothetical protein DD712_03765 [Candidatus Acetothermia bacterium]|nr:hypothetical protein [Candidatus Acetothermia bacterium]